MSRWRFHNPVRIHFGEGVLDEIGDVVARRAYVLLTHPDATMAPWRARISERAGPPLLTLDDIEPNPSLAMLERLCAGLGQAGAEPEMIVALGGGSVMDSAKVVAAGRGRYDPVLRHLEGIESQLPPALPIIAVPTTAGTGSDLTKWATVWDPDRGRKLSLNRDDLYPEAVLIDPLVMATLPWPTTLASGLDALSHALESLWNINANPVTRAFAISAAHDLMAGLPRLQRDLGDGEARSLMARGAARAGLAFSNTRTALAHNISYPITLGRQIPHGIACSFCLPEVMAAAIGADTACDAALDAIFGDLARAPTTLRRLLDNLGVASGPDALGIGPDEWREIVDDAFAGPRGRNFIGSPATFPSAAILAGV